MADVLALLKDKRFLLGFCAAIIGTWLVAVLRGFLGAAWQDLKAWHRRRRLLKDRHCVRWESLPDHINCRCAMTPLDDFHDATPTEGLKP